ncbi:MAG: metal ABC transporter substrate-binding protein [Anaerolineae bacterium]|nr:metal ABC transporter substrate-binding protein [Anaerolineae bacterium]
MKTLFHHLAALSLGLSIVLAACSPAATEAPAAAAPQNSSLKVLASTSFLADIAQNVAGERARVEALLPLGTDPHAYQPVPGDVAKISQSNVLILNGVEYESFIEPILKNTEGERLQIIASTGLEVNQMEEPEEEGQEDHEHEAGDPHMWLDPTRVITYVANIRDGLSRADPDGAAVYKANAEAYTQQLNQLDAWIKEQVNSIPAERRLLVTNHEALGYFDARYGFKTVGAIIPSLSTEASPSAQQLAALVDQINSTHVPAIFIGESENPKLAQQIAEETGVKVVEDLYLETLTAGAPAATYIDMMKHNVTAIVEALK